MTWRSDEGGWAAAVAAATGGSAWNPSDLTGSVTLSNSNKNASSSPPGSPQGVRGTQSRIASNSRCLEFIASAAWRNNFAIGLADASTSLTSVTGDTNTSVLYKPITGQWYLNGAFQATVATCTTGDNVQFVYNASGVSAYKNGSLLFTGNPNGGALFPIALWSASLGASDATLKTAAANIVNLISGTTAWG